MYQLSELPPSTQQIIVIVCFALLIATAYIPRSWRLMAKDDPETCPLTATDSIEATNEHFSLSPAPIDERQPLASIPQPAVSLTTPIAEAITEASDAQWLQTLNQLPSDPENQWKSSKMPAGWIREYADEMERLKQVVKETLEKHFNGEATRAWRGSKPQEQPFYVARQSLLEVEPVLPESMIYKIVTDVWMHRKGKAYGKHIRLRAWILPDPQAPATPTATQAPARTLVMRLIEAEIKGVFAEDSAIKQATTTDSGIGPLKMNRYHGYYPLAYGDEQIDIWDDEERRLLYCNTLKKYKDTMNIVASPDPNIDCRSPEERAAEAAALAAATGSAKKRQAFVIV